MTIIDAWREIMETRRLYRSREDRMLSGVAGGIAEYFGVDPTLVRLALFFGLLFTTGPLAPLVYLILVWIIPKKPIGE